MHEELRRELQQKLDWYLRLMGGEELPSYNASHDGYPIDVGREFYIQNAYINFNIAHFTLQ